MDEAEARSILTDALDRLRTVAFEDLVARYLDDVDTTVVTGPSGTVYQLEIEAFWDDPRRPGENLRVMVAIDDGRGWRSISPLTSSFIITPAGAFVGE